MTIALWHVEAAWKPRGLIVCHGKEDWGGLGTILYAAQNFHRSVRANYFPFLYINKGYKEYRIAVMLDVHSTCQCAIKQQY